MCIRDRLYDTYGFPLDLTEDVLQDAGFTVDADVFAEKMDAQRRRARAARENLSAAGGWDSTGPVSYTHLAMRLAPGLDPAVWQSPNNLLAVEYIKALRVSGAQIEPYTVARRGAGHDAGAAAGDYQSATFCRELIQSGRDCSPYLPAPAAEILRREMDEGRAPVSIGGMERAMLASLRRLPPAAFTMYPDVTEGLENRIADALRRERSMPVSYTHLDVYKRQICDESPASYRTSR